jgi:hypothetical protein
MLLLALGLIMTADHILNILALLAPKILGLYSN